MNQVVVNENNFDERAALLNRENEQMEKMQERGEKSPFTNFVQLNRKNIVHIIEACSKNKQAVRVLLLIIRYMDSHNAVVCPYSVFEKELEISHPTISRSLHYLKEKGFIDIKKLGKNNKYIVNNDLVWMSKASKLQYCQYDGNVLDTSEEKGNKKETEDEEEKNKIEFTRIISNSCEK